jgi:hypothetical protein
MPRHSPNEDRCPSNAERVGPLGEPDRAERRARVAELRQRVSAGTYETAAVRDQVARAILQRGELLSLPGSSAGAPFH